MNGQAINKVLASVLPMTKQEGDALKKKTVFGTFHTGGLSGNRLNSGTLRSQIIVCESKADWDNSTARKALHSDQRVFVQTGDDIWDVYAGATLDSESSEPIIVARNRTGLHDLLIEAKAELLPCSSPASLASGRDYALQLITYGAPGTGKSHRTEEVVKAFADTVRTTFHPDSDYATFVGCYKPTMESVKKTYVLEGRDADVKDDSNDPVFEEKIVYSFVPQAFTKAYLRAWGKMANPGADGKVEPQFLVIEEINRGNCAQIFGDLFQLLDRDDDGYSKYAIEADDDLGRYIKNWFADNLGNPANPVKEDVLSGTHLILPPNLYIWATMNTSDQSLFPIDSAFKRRWEWQYIPISDAGKEWKIRVKTASGAATAAQGDAEDAAATVEDGTGNGVATTQDFDWWKFLERINALILSATQSEDKQLGYFFAKPDNGGDIILAAKFVNKVLFYLFNDVFKDYDLPKGFAKPDGKGKFAFKDFFLPDGKPNETAVKDLLTGLLAQPQ